VSLLDVIADFATGGDESTPFKYTLTRTSAGTYDANGKLVAGTPTTSLITASVQPTNGRDLRVLLEAGITEESKVVYTEGPLLTRRPGQEPDVLTIRGEPWVCHQSQEWEFDDEIFYRSLVARKSLQ
jgi:hypothetical protein